MLVSDRQKAEILRMGLARVPNEACGFLLTFPGGPNDVVELKNCSSEPRDTVAMDPAELRRALLDVVGSRQALLERLEQHLVVWHTHPSGHVGPSKTDMEFRRTIPEVRCLVVTLPTGEAVQF